MLIEAHQFITFVF